MPVENGIRKRPNLFQYNRHRQFIQPALTIEQVPVQNFLQKVWFAWLIDKLFIDAYFSRLSIQMFFATQPILPAGQAQS